MNTDLDFTSKLDSVKHREVLEKVKMFINDPAIKGLNLKVDFNLIFFPPPLSPSDGHQGLADRLRENLK